MGNIISLKICGQHMSMSNGLTSVFISTLGLSGTHLAKTDDEKQMIIWLLEKDQSVTGDGTVGFDICEMPWNAASFNETKCFLQDVIEGAKKKIGWEFLGYQPNEEFLYPRFEQFYQLISNVDMSMLHPTEYMKVPNNPVVCGYPCCQKHPVLLTGFGCYLCNN